MDVPGTLLFLDNWATPDNALTPFLLELKVDWHLGTYSTTYQKLYAIHFSTKLDVPDLLWNSLEPASE